jgi:SAM-dependent methyltransferase
MAFDTVASYYDRMTGFADRLINDFGVIKHLVKKYKISSALDAGCGTGVHTIILSKLGVEVLGFDASPEMLEIARANALREGVRPQLAHEYFETIPEEWWQKYDGLFCLANSLVSVQNARRLALALKSFHRSLKPGGHAIIQILNTARFRRTDQRIIKVSTVDNYTFVRFFDFDETETRLNVISIEHDMGGVNHTMTSTKILPLTKDMLTLAAKTAGFSDAEFYGDLVLSEPYTGDNVNLVAILTK